MSNTSNQTPNTKHQTPNTKHHDRISILKWSVFSGLALFVLLTSSILLTEQPATSTSQQHYADDPPEMTAIYLKKDETGPKNALVKVIYDYYENLPDSIVLYAAGQQNTFYDNGIYPDSVANDNHFTAAVNIDFSSFWAELTHLNYLASTEEKWIVFKGHTGEFRNNLKLFDVDNFNSGHWTHLDLDYIEIADCKTEIKPQNSLLITDLSVVEDPARTYNFVTESGTPNGVWTFGHLMKEMANEPLTGVSTKEFIKQWIKSYTITQTFSYPNNLSVAVPNRDFILDIIIQPWINKANGNSTPSMLITDQNWESLWDNTNEGELLKYAPFKLTAIANRLDLKGNFSYIPHLTKRKLKAGETRFVFTLLNHYNTMAYGTAGMPPHTPLENQGVYSSGSGFTSFNANGSESFQDWVGMNVIFEYLNVQTSLCDLHNFANNWYQLSGFEFGENYNMALENITKTVIDRNANHQNPNGSTIGRIRTNEKIFAHTLPSSNPQGIATWGGGCLAV